MLCEEEHEDESVSSGRGWCVARMKREAGEKLPGLKMSGVLCFPKL